MNFRLARLYAVRAANPTALLVLAGVLAISHLSGGSSAKALQFDRARALWLVALIVLGAWSLLRSSTICSAWFSREGNWLGSSAASRATIISSALFGTLVGTLALTAATTLVIGAISPRQQGATERYALAGPVQSLRLISGESFTQTLAASLVPNDATVRVRVTPTAGGVGPTTTVAAMTSSGSITGGSTAMPLARRTWIEIPFGDAGDDSHSVVVTNTGDGALAVLGPRAVEIWRPSRARLGGHLRVGLHAALLLACAVALGFAAGAWMRPGIASVLGFSVWLAAATRGAQLDWLPGGPGLDRALGAIAEGRHPAGPPLLAGALTITVLFLAGAAARPALGCWQRDGQA